MKKLLALLFIASTILISCEQNGVNEPDNPKDAPSFTFMEGTEVNPTIGYVGGELVFSFISNCSWTVEENDDWINISPTSGNQGNHTLVINVAKNTTGEERLSKITILYGVDSQVVINLTQEANEVFETDSDGNYIVEAVGGTVAVKVTANLEYDVVIDEDAQSWLSVADTRAVREETLIFTVAENESFDERSATVELKDADGKVLQSVSFKQKGVEEVFDTDSEGNYIVEADGGTVAVKVTTNLEYDVIIPNEALAWISLADTRAVREETLTFNVAKNEGSEERSATVNLCAKGGDILQTITIKQNKPTTISCANNEIIYTTKYGYPIELNTTDGFGGNIMSHTYENGYGRISFDNDVVSIPNEAFNGCTTLTTIVLPNSLSTIDSSAFSGCTSLTSITIPDSVTSIGDSAFSGCTSLTSITIGKGVTSIGKNAFSGCTGELIVNCNIPSASSYDYGAFRGSKFTQVTIGDSVTSIGDYAFYGCSNLTSITIPDSVTSIGELAFYHCTSLASVNIPDSVTSIGGGAFWGCTSLTSITIPDSVTSIGSSAFSGCLFTKETFINNSSLDAETNNYWGASIYVIQEDGLCINGTIAVDCRKEATSVTIPDSVTSIGDDAFYECTSLTSITIPDSVTTIGRYAFYGCTSLTSITIPDSVTTIGHFAFWDCASLKSVTIGSGVTSIGSLAFYRCTSLIRFNGKFASEDNRCLIFDGRLVAFACASLTEYAIPDSVTSIGSQAFSGCDSLTSITIPDSVTSIGSQAFYGCDSLTSITIPNSVTSIRIQAFYYCTSLKEVYCKPTTPPTGDSSMFSQNASDRKIYVPMQSINDYKVADGWKEYADKIIGYDFENNAII